MDLLTHIVQTNQLKSQKAYEMLKRMCLVHDAEIRLAALDSLKLLYATNSKFQKIIHQEAFHLLNMLTALEPPEELGNYMTLCNY